MAAVRGGLMSDSVAVVWDDSLLGYTMGGDHPLHPVRLDLTMRLADGLGVLATDRIRLLTPTPPPRRPPPARRPPTSTCSPSCTIPRTSRRCAGRRRPPASVTGWARRTTRSSRGCTT